MSKVNNLMSCNYIEYFTTFYSTWIDKQDIVVKCVKGVWNFE